MSSIDRSYSFVPSQADASVFDAVGKKCPDSSKYPHIARWFRHIESFSPAGRKQFQKSKKTDYVSGGGGAAAADDDDDVDMFGDDDEEEEEDADKARIREERLAAYAAKKSSKPTLIAKTSVLLDCKPWDDETDMDAMLKLVKAIEMDGLLWGACKCDIY